MLYKYQMSYINVIQLSQNPFRSQFFLWAQFHSLSLPRVAHQTTALAHGATRNVRGLVELHGAPHFPPRCRDS